MSADANYCTVFLFVLRQPGTRGYWRGLLGNAARGAVQTRAPISCALKVRSSSARADRNWRGLVVFILKAGTDINEFHHQVVTRSARHLLHIVTEPEDSCVPPPSPLPPQFALRVLHGRCASVCVERLATAAHGRGGEPPAPRTPALRDLAAGVCRGHRHGRHRPAPPFRPRPRMAPERRVRSVRRRARPLRVGSVG